MYPSTKVDLIYYDSFYEIYVLSSSISSSRKISKSLSSFPYWKQPPPTRTKYPFETLLKLCWIHKLIWQELILLNDSNVNLELSLSFFSNDTLYLQVKFINFFVQNIFSNIIANCFIFYVGIMSDIFSTIYSTWLLLENKKTVGSI